MWARRRGTSPREASLKISELFNVEGLGVIVTGGASGLGLGYAEALAENGARVTILDVDADRVDQETRRLRDLGLGCSRRGGRCARSSGHRRGIRRGGVAHGRLDVVFANAGVDPGSRLRGQLGGRRSGRAIAKVPSRITPMSAGIG